MCMASKYRAAGSFPSGLSVCECVAKLLGKRAQPFRGRRTVAFDVHPYLLCFARGALRCEGDSNALFVEIDAENLERGRHARGDLRGPSARPARWVERRGVRQGFDPRLE